MPESCGQRVGGQFIVGSGVPLACGTGKQAINGSFFAEGPVVFGDPLAFPPIPYATVNIGRLSNSDPDVKTPFVPGSLCAGTHSPYDLCVDGNTALMKNLDVNLDIQCANLRAQGEVVSNCGGHYLSAKKNFDIPHPTKEGWRLRHTCPEGPSNDVYYRGRVVNQTEILLPVYWKKLVDWTTITVNLTPIGAHQNVIVKRIDEDKVYLQAHGGMPINCFFHIFGTRADGERLIPEYEGQTPADYPGNNDEYSVSGYHYDKKEN